MEKYSLRLGKSVQLTNDGTFFENIKTVKALGFDTVDYDLCRFWREPENEAELLKDLEKGAQAVVDEGLKINGVHISFGNEWDISCTDEKRRAEIVAKIKGVISRLDGFKPFCYVLHGSFEPIAPDVRQSKLDALVRSLNEIIPFTKTVIALEDLPRTCLFNTAKEGLEIIAKTGVKVCLDTNHFLQEKTEDAVLALGKNIVTTHVSDHDYEDERHWLPKSGKIDWNAVLKNLQAVGYNGVFNYETGKYPIEEVKNNFLELFKEYNEK